MCFMKIDDKVETDFSCNRTYMSETKQIHRNRTEKERKKEKRK